MAEQNNKTLNQAIDFHLKVGQTVTVNLYNRARLVLSLSGQLKREYDHGQFYIRSDDFFFIFTDIGYDYFDVYTTPAYISLGVA